MGLHVIKKAAGYHILWIDILVFVGKFVWKGMNYRRMIVKEDWVTIHSSFN